MIEWRGYWQPFTAPHREGELLQELARETGHANPKHPLHGKTCRIVGWGVHRFAKPPTIDSGLKGWKNLMLFVPSENRYAFVHLTWTTETDPNWPMCELFESVEEVSAFIRRYGDAK